MTQSNHHCSYRGCNKMLAKCTAHNWECTGGVTGPVHGRRIVPKNKACEETYVEYKMKPNARGVLVNTKIEYRCGGRFIPA